MSDISPGTIGLLIDWLDDDSASSLAFACCDEVVSRGMRFLTFVGHGLDEQGEPADAGNLAYELAAGGVLDGLIVLSLGNACGAELQQRYLERFRPLPLCTFSIELPGVPRVSVDNAAGMRQAVSHLITRHGRRRIALIRGPDNTPDAQRRHQGYLEALNEHGLPVNPQLIVPGDFGRESAGRAVSTLLDDRRVAFDALVAANDAMAVAAVMLLGMRGLSVPEDVAVCGFDDVEEARFANPPITSVRQPWRARARLAVDALMAQREGRAVGRCVVSAELVPRPSCGCGVSFSAAHRAPRLGHGVASWDWRKSTALALCSGLSLRGLRLEAEPARALVECFWQQVTAQREGGFLLLLAQELSEQLHQRSSLSAWYHALSRLRRDVLERVTSSPEQMALAESLIHAGVERVGYAVEQQQALRRLEFERQGHLLALGGQATSTAFNARGLGDALVHQLPELGVPSHFTCRFETPGGAWPARARLLIANDVTRAQVEDLGSDFDASDLLPAKAWPARWASGFVVESLHFQAQRLGYAIFQIGPRQGSIYVALREQLSAALEGAALVRQVEERALQRAQAEKARMQEELRIARQVQVSILPTRWQIEGIEVAAAMSPGQLGGADYFDVRPDARGAWLALGSSRGAGVAAGLVIPMLHSTVASLCHSPQLSEPEALLRLALLVMKEHLETRLRERHYVSLLVARYDGATGRIGFAGDYEGITSCPWHGSAGRPEQRVVGETPEGEPVVGGELYLAPHDLLLLHTQGLTRSSDFEDAPIDADNVGFELERRRAEPVDEIRDGVLRLVESWSGRRADLSVIVGRRLGPG